MRIQHNITALNALNNYNTNNSAVSSNLEKLSSGYKINSASDDAAGLAISEKMRAQITGLDTAENNANDGISLVQTAEGALTEVHSMLNRMTELADQSANGTYQDDVDRKSIQSEIDSLSDEIDRISESINFNGINLLDGSLGSSSAKGVAVDVNYSALSANPSVLSLQAATSTNAKVKIDTSTALASGDYSIEMKYSDADGNLQSKNISFTATGTATTDQASIKSAFADAFGSDYTVTQTGDEYTITANNAGSDNKLAVYTVDVKDPTGVAASIGSVVQNTAGEDAYYQLDSAQLGAYTGAAGEDASDYIFEINGQKFAFTSAAGAGDLDPDVNYVETANTTLNATDAAAMVKLINNKTGIGAEQLATPDAKINLKAGTTTATSGSGLTLQIGDTSDKFNQLTVSIDNMSSQSLGIGGIDLSTQSGAKSAIDKIKEAINTVSSTRGNLGAIQNRLEHTINSLSATNENITAAESRIRDVDMAQEMMDYTKNNILVQASQSMLAQANQTPQGVLQLLQ